MVKQLTKPEVPYVKDKAEPKRALIVIVAFITSIILGIFLVFFREFLKSNKEEEKADETYKYINE
jgi:LPS O-antigen subunit length determinant protein (WzzB/FepE family)